MSERNRPTRSVKASELLPGDIVFQPDAPTDRKLYRVLEVRAVKTNRTVVHVMLPDGDQLRELPNHIDYPINRAADAQ